MKETGFGKYALVGRLGGGGMAEVFHARLAGPSGFSKDVALKLILPHFSDEPEFVKMFIQEATLAARLDHANIVRIYEFDKIEGRYAIAMELVDGKDLRQLFARAKELDRRISVPEALAIVYQVCQGLAFAHGELSEGAAPVIHRDISPHNIILSRAGEVKITDFGIAKLASASGFTRTGVIKGKVSYMSPEQARGEPVDARSDLFSLACVLWESLAGQRLFTGESDLAVLEKVKQAQVPPPSSFRREIPPEVDRLLLTALQREPKDRFQSATVFGAEIDRILAGFQDLNRVTLLVKLYRDVFAGVERQEGTPLLQLPVERPSAPASPPAPPSLLLARTVIEPIGPDAATRIETAPTPEVAPGASRRRWLGFAAAALAILAVGAWWGLRSPEGPESAEAPVPAIADGEAEGAAAAREEPRADSPEDAGPGLAASMDAGMGSGPDGVVLTAMTGGGDARDAGPEDAAGAAALSRPKETLAGAGTRPPDASGAAQPRKPGAAPGYLRLNVIPWARVFHGKKFLGETPIEDLILPPGDYTLWLEASEPRLSRKVNVTIRSRKTTQQVVDLRK
jgi:serine/threonine-protein kinase